MPQVDAKILDYSDDMKAYFADVTRILVQRRGKSADEAHLLVDQYFSMDVDPMERALVMHVEAASVAEDLAGRSDVTGRQTAPWALQR